MHENQKMANDMTRMGKEALRNINDRHFSRSEIWDFIGDIIEARIKDDKIDKVFDKWSKK